MSAIDGLGRGLKGKARLLLLTCLGPFHFWPYRAFYKCRCLCGKRYHKDPKKNDTEHVVLLTDEGRPQGWQQKAQAEDLGKHGYVKRSDYEKTFLFNPFTGDRLAD